MNIPCSKMESRPTRREGLSDRLNWMTGLHKWSGWLRDAKLKRIASGSYILFCQRGTNASRLDLGRVLICGRPARCKRFLKKIGTCSRMLPSVRPLMQQ